MTEAEYDALDPGIRDVVRLLNDHGFHTTDSGDGASKSEDWFTSGEALRYPHVVCAVSPPEELINEAHRLHDLLGDRWRIEASYDPRGDAADYGIIMADQCNLEAEYHRQQKDAQHADDLETALRRLEWAGTVWTDAQVCLFCGAHKEGLPANTVLQRPAQAPLKHQPDCEWVALVRSGAA